MSRGTRIAPLSLGLPQSITPDRESEGILPYEVMEIASSELSKPRFARQCNGDWIKKTIAFINEKIVQPAVDYRTSYGLSEAGTSATHKPSVDRKAPGM